MFWDNVKAELDFQGLLVKELSQKSGLNFNSLCNGMSRKTIPSVEVAYKIASALNVSIEYLYSGIRQKNELSQDDKSLLNEYHQLSDHDKKVLKTILATMNKVAAEISPDDTNYVIVK